MTSYYVGRFIKKYFDVLKNLLKTFLKDKMQWKLFCFDVPLSTALTG